MLDNFADRATVRAMPETTPPNTADAGLEVCTSFVRNRHALLARADFGELFVDYYLHLGSKDRKSTRLNSSHSS